MSMRCWLGPFNTGPAVGAAGSATSQLKTALSIDGAIKSVLFHFNGTCPVGTIVTSLITSGDHAPVYNVLVRTHDKTVGPFNPRLLAQDLTGTNLLYFVGHAIGTQLQIDDHLIILVQGVNAGDSVDCWVLLDDTRVYL